MKENTVKFLILTGILALVWFLGIFFHVDTAFVQGTLQKLPIFYSSVLFILLYCGVTFFIWLSKDIFRLISALVFGAYLSTLLIWVAEIFNACILFNLSRKLGRNFVENSLKGKLGNLDKKLGKLNFFWLFMFRSVPLVPFRFLDLGCGLTNLSFKKYLLAVILGSPLRIFWVQFVLAGVGAAVFSNPAALTEFLVANKPLFILSFVYIILVILVAFKFKSRG